MVDHNTEFHPQTQEFIKGTSRQDWVKRLKASIWKTTAPRQENCYRPWNVLGVRLIVSINNGKVKKARTQQKLSRFNRCRVQMIQRTSVVKNLIISLPFNHVDIKTFNVSDYKRQLSVQNLKTIARFSNVKMDRSQWTKSK